MPEPSPPSQPVGVPFGRYVIRTRLGRGGMGEVFLADQLGPLGPVRPVALKRLLPAHTDNPQVVRLFLEEMGTAAQLSHPNIAVTYDFGEVEGVYFMAMEYVDGLPLDQLIRGAGPIPVDAAVTLGLSVARALQHAHDRHSGGAPAPVVHQDVTPHNVIVSREGEAKLLDFGIARTEAIARQGRLRAKVRYAAPEQLRGATPDRRFDVWGLGVTLYQALTGRLPFPQTELEARLEAAEAGRFTPLATLAPEATHVSEVISKALRPDPADRFGSVQQMHAALQAAHDVTEARGRATLTELVERVAAAPAHLDGGELTSTGVAAEGSVTPVLPPRPAPAFEDDGPTRITRSTVPATEAPELPPAAPPPRRRAVAVVLAGLLVGAAVVVGARAIWPPGPPVTQVNLLPRPTGETARGGEAEPGEGEATGGQQAPLPAPVDAGDVGEAPPEAPPAVTKARPAAARRATARRRRPPPKTAAAPSSAPAADAGAEDALGLLSVRTVPWARVAVDGRPLGEGVIARRPLEAGAHTLRLEAGAGNFPPREISIRIEGGRTTRVFFDFSTGVLRITPRP